jgi:hypothetical protein
MIEREVIDEKGGAVKKNDLNGKNNIPYSQ